MLKTTSISTQKPKRKIDCSRFVVGVRPRPTSSTNNPTIKERSVFASLKQRDCPKEITASLCIVVKACFAKHDGQEIVQIISDSFKAPREWLHRGPKETA